MLKVLHFADAHIDMATQGRHDPVSGLPVRILDFLKALDTIVDTAIDERVDLVLFAGDAYKDRSPAPTFQREWGRRIMRLSQAGIPTLLLVGNHDLSPAAGRAHALQEYDTLQVPKVRVAGRPCFLTPADLWGLPLQIVALPWVTRSNIMAALELSAADPAQVYAELETRLIDLVNLWLDSADPSLPVILTAHASVQGAVFGAERAVMLGGDLVLSGGLVRDPRLDYVALGHIHKAQDLGKDEAHPIIYPGSIERVDWGEAADDKFFVIAALEKGQKTQVEWRKLVGRRFIDRSLRVTSPDDILEQAKAVLPSREEMVEAQVRLTLTLPRPWDSLLDETALRAYADTAFDFHLIRRLEMEARLRLPSDRPISSLTAPDLMHLYWDTVKVDGEEAGALQKLAEAIISGDEQEKPDQS
jgi:DNA repair protein SbcD/Mre11